MLIRENRVSMLMEPKNLELDNLREATFSVSVRCYGSHADDCIERCGSFAEDVRAR